MAVDDGYTKVLLHLNGTDGSTTITDESGKSWSAAGNAQIDTAQSVFGGASCVFDGSGDYLTTPDHAGFTMGTNDFTIDFWVRFNALPASGQVSCFFSQIASNWRAFYLWNNANTHTLVFRSYESGVYVIDLQRAGGNFGINTWYHIALVRNGNDFYVFRDGAQYGSTYTDSDALGDIAASPIIGAYGTTTYYLNGWIDEFRYSLGVARWTTNFTPPTAEYAPAAGSVRLLHPIFSVGA